MPDTPEQHGGAAKTPRPDAASQPDRERVATWVHLPRRLLFLLLAGAAATLLTSVLPILSPTGPPGFLAVGPRPPLPTLGS